jgi:hypothetical protein
MASVLHNPKDAKFIEFLEANGPPFTGLVKVYMDYKKKCEEKGEEAAGITAFVAPMFAHHGEGSRMELILNKMGFRSIIHNGEKALEFIRIPASDDTPQASSM